MSLIKNWPWQNDDYEEVKQLICEKTANSAEFEVLLRKISKYNFSIRQVEQFLINTLDNPSREYNGKPTSSIFFEELLPHIKKWAILGEKYIKQNQTILLGNLKPSAIKLSRMECLCLNSMFFLGLFDRYPPMNPNNNSYIMTMRNIYMYENYLAFEAFITYFYSCYSSQEILEDTPVNSVYICKRCVSGVPNWSQDVPLKSVFVMTNEDKITDYDAVIRGEIFDCENEPLKNIFELPMTTKYIELFCRPEIFATLIFLEGRLSREKETLVIRNLLTFMIYGRKSNSLRIIDTHIERKNATNDIVQVPMCTTIPINILLIPLNNDGNSLKNTSHLDLNKIYSAMFGNILCKTTTIGGTSTNKYVRFLQQWMAATKAETYLMYEVNKNFSMEIENFTDILVKKNIKLKNLYSYYNSIISRHNLTINEIDIFNEILKYVNL